MTDDGVDDTVGECDTDEAEFEVDDSTNVSVLADNSATVVTDRSVSVVVETSTVIGFSVVTSGDDELSMIDVISKQKSMQFIFIAGETKLHLKTSPVELLTQVIYI